MHGSTLTRALRLTIGIKLDLYGITNGGKSAGVTHRALKIGVECAQGLDHVLIFRNRKGCLNPQAARGLKPEARVIGGVTAHE